MGVFVFVGNCVIVVEGWYVLLFVVYVCVVGLCVGVVGVVG